MAFAYTIDTQTVFGNKRVIMGTFTNGAGDSGGDIVTGLQVVDFATLQSTGDTVIAAAPTINETFPSAPGTLTIVNTANEDGIWMAIGV